MKAILSKVKLPVCYGVVWWGALPKEKPDSYREVDTLVCPRCGNQLVHLEDSLMCFDCYLDGIEYPDEYIGE